MTFSLTSCRRLASADQGQNLFQPRLKVVVDGFGEKRDIARQQAGGQVVALLACNRSPRGELGPLART